MTILQVDQLTKKIKGMPIIQDVSFKLDEGQIVGLVGANGAGKTTLMKVILGLSNYQDGSYKVRANTNNKSNTGALIESPGVYPFLTGYDNLKLLCESKKNKSNTDAIKERPGF